MDARYQDYQQVDTDSKKVAILRKDAFPQLKDQFQSYLGKEVIRKVKRRKSDQNDSSYDIQHVVIESCFDSSVLVTRSVKRGNKEVYVLRFCINYSSLLTQEEIIELPEISC